MLSPVDIAKGALVDAGCPELALLVRENRAGFPSLNDLAQALGGLKKMKPEGRDLIIRAFWLGHQSVHRSAMLHIHEDVCSDHLGICCNECHPGICDGN